MSKNWVAKPERPRKRRRSHWRGEEGRVDEEVGEGDGEVAEEGETRGKRRRRVEIRVVEKAK